MNLNLSDPKFIVLAAVVILVIAVLAWLYVRKRRSATASLRQKFGPEYERAVQKHGSERKAEAKLADRQERVEKLKIRDLDPTERERFSKQWESVQSRFVDSPKGAVAEADDLVSSLMRFNAAAQRVVYIAGHGSRTWPLRASGSNVTRNLSNPLLS